MSPDESNKVYLKLRIKKSKRVDFLDDLEIIKQSKFDEDENYYYVYFDEIDHQVKALFNSVWTLKATKIWINGKEIIHDTGYPSEVIFCLYKDICEGICYHDIRLIYSAFVNGDDPFYIEKSAKIQSIKGAKAWFEENQTISRIVNHEDDVLKKLNEYTILEHDKELLTFSINIDQIRHYVLRKLSFELSYCPLISEKKIVDYINTFPTQLKYTKEVYKYLSMETKRDLFEIIDLEEEHAIQTKGYSEEPYEEEPLSIKLSDEAIEKLGDEFEKRLRNVLSEFSKK